MQYFAKYVFYLYIWTVAFDGRAQETDTFHVYFDLNIPGLNSAARKHIDSLLYYDAVGPANYILIIGYADYLGNDTANYILSEKRAKNVRNYLLSMNIDTTHIKSYIGRGAVQRAVHTSEGSARDRRVDIVVGKTKSLFNTPAKPKAKITSAAQPSLATIIDSLKIGQSFILDNLYFYTGRHTVKEESLVELDKLYQVLKENPNLKIRIEGHVCCVPNDKDALDEDMNLIRQKGDEPSPYFLRRLSLNRAMYIYHYLVKKGISSKRLEYEGYGRSRPLVQNETSLADEDKNKRVEIRIINK